MSDRSATHAPIDPDVSLGHDREWLLQLAGELAQTLELDALLDTFSARTAELVRHDGLRFIESEAEIRFATGAPAACAGAQDDTPAHTCTYELVLPDAPLGTVVFTRTEPFSAPETDALQNVVLNLAYPLRNALLYRRALRASEKDGLTALGNRTALATALSRAFAAANRHGDPLSVIMLDVDFFKQVNDRHGHPIGDEVLCALADVLGDEIRDCDMAFRYGGEEFIMVLEKTGLQGACLLAERIRERVAQLEIETGAGPLQVTISLGVAMLEPGDTPESLVARADEALYASKEGGRNRVTAHSSSSKDGSPDAGPTAGTRPAKPARA